MSQLRTLVWLKWKLFRNAMRSRRASTNQATTILGTLAALAFAIAVATGLGIAAYAILSDNGAAQILQARGVTRSTGDVEKGSFFLFMIFAFLYMLWATLPLSIGGGSQFDPGRLLMYPVSLKKLFAIDLASGLASLPSLFAVPMIVAIAIGAGLATGSLLKAFIAAALAILSRAA